MADLQAQIDALTTRVAALEAERWAGPPRLGPRPLTHQEEVELAQRMGDRLVQSIRQQQSRAVSPVDPGVDNSADPKEGPNT